HVAGSVNCARAVWNLMREQQYGRIVLTTSSSGLYGNFGQSNYGAAKMALVGLMNTLHLEGHKYNIRVNCLAPCAATRMLEGLMPDEALSLLAPETVTPGVVFLVSADAPERVILAAGGGGFAQARIYETEGICLAPENLSPEVVAERWDEICATDGQREPAFGGEQSIKFLEKAAALRGIAPPPRR
ncbi:MAG: SDR family NAD(P)-dependent oxidoreductase, partial [Gammaproteobacteria bacterium]|nr:SDR family NAD(P)-dependent oxidoreductase [Gammaproteobacteria bacterium]